MSLFIVLLMDIQRFNFFCHAAILSVALFMCPLTYVQEFLYSVYLGIESLLCGSAQLFFYSVLPNCFPDWLYWLIVPPTGRESSLYLSPLGFTFLNWFDGGKIVSLFAVSFPWILIGLIEFLKNVNKNEAKQKYIRFVDHLVSLFCETALSFTTLLKNFFFNWIAFLCLKGAHFLWLHALCP